MRLKRTLFTIAALLTLLTGRAANIITSEGAWCWFADPRAIHYANDAKTVDITLLGYIDVHGQIKATQIDWNKGTRNEVLVRGAFETDDHDNPTFLVLPDERIMVFYSYHSKSTMFYRVSKRPGDITCLGPEKQMAFDYKTTYPSPFILSDDPDHIYICWRGGENWHPTIARTTLPDENDDVQIVFGPKQMVQSTGARPYAKYQSNGKDKIYMTYTTGHPDNEMPNWVYFNVIHINNGSPVLTDIAGDTLKAVKDGPFNVNKTAAYKTNYPLTVIDAPTDKRDWVWQIARDKEDRPVVLMVRMDDGRTNHTYNYMKWTGTEWRETELSFAGHAFHLNWSSRERCYSAGMTIDPDTANHAYLSLPTKNGEVNKDGVYELWKYVLDDEGNVTSRTQLTFDSKKNNVRPYILPGSAGTPLRLAWMNGNYHFWSSTSKYPQAYPTAIWTDGDIPQQGVDLNNGLTSHLSPLTSPLSISTQVTLPQTKSKYLGTFFSTENMSLQIVDDYNLQLTIGDMTLRSPSRMLATDALIRGVTEMSGESGHTAMLPKVTMTLTYDGNRLTVYRNGLIDMQTDVTGLQFGSLQEGTYDNAQTLIWSRPLNNDEVRELANTKFGDITSSISSLDYFTISPFDNCTYNLHGRKLSNSQLQKGIIIINGKKIIK